MSPSTNGASRPDQLPSVRILGVSIARAHAGEALRVIEGAADRGGPVSIAFANAHSLNLVARDSGHARALRREMNLVLNDGIGVQLAARMRGTPFPENLNGSDFTPRILELAAARGWKVYLLGGSEGVAERAAERLRATDENLNVVGTHHGYFEPSEDAKVAALVKASGADVVLVAMGNPRQEKWLAANLGFTGASVGVGVGAFFDFTVGAQRRAPSWMNRLGIEWVYRLVREPGRMWRRYIVGNPAFLWRAWLARKSDRPFGR